MSSRMGTWPLEVHQAVGVRGGEARSNDHGRERMVVLLVVCGGVLLTHKAEQRVGTMMVARRLAELDALAPGISVETARDRIRTLNSV